MHRRAAARALRDNGELAELEPLLALFASLALPSEVVGQIMRWDMAVLRESPWYNEILQEGFDKGIEQGIERGIEQGIKQGQVLAILRLLERRFGELDQALAEQIRSLPTDQLQPLFDFVFDAPTLEAVIANLDKLS